MSWAAHDVEGWQQVEVTALSRYLIALNPSLKDERLAVVLDALQDEFPFQFQRVMEQVPSTYLWGAEADYHISKEHCG